MIVSVFHVPHEAVPAIVIPDGRRPLRLGRRVIVGAAFARYVPGGVLDYNELLVAVPSFGRGGLRITITRIWVDSEASMIGGRELWGIPKHLAKFDRAENRRDSARRGADTATVSMTLPVSTTPVASVAARIGRALFPGMPQLPLPTLQAFEGRRILSRNRVIGRFRALHAAWAFDPDGELGYLSGRRPFLSVAIRDAAIIFGMNVERS